MKNISITSGETENMIIFIMINCRYRYTNCNLGKGKKGFNFTMFIIHCKFLYEI